jgi:hypothetical protein
MERIVNDILREKSKQLLAIYSEDLEPNLENDIIQFKTNKIFFRKRKRKYL